MNNASLEGDGLCHSKYTDGSSYYTGPRLSVIRVWCLLVLLYHRSWRTKQMIHMGQVQPSFLWTRIILSNRWMCHWEHDVLRVPWMKWSSSPRGPSVTVPDNLGTGDATVLSLPFLFVGRGFSLIVKPTGLQTPKILLSWTTYQVKWWRKSFKERRLKILLNPKISTFLEPYPQLVIVLDNYRAPEVEDGGPVKTKMMWWPNPT